MRGQRIVLLTDALRAATVLTGIRLRARAALLVLPLSKEVWAPRAALCAPRGHMQEWEQARARAARWVLTKLLTASRSACRVRPVPFKRRLDRSAARAAVRVSIRPRPVPGAVRRSALQAISRTSVPRNARYARSELSRQTRARPAVPTVPQQQQGARSCARAAPVNSVPSNASSVCLASILQL